MNEHTPAKQIHNAIDDMVRDYADHGNGVPPLMDVVRVKPASVHVIAKGVKKMKDVIATIALKELPLDRITSALATANAEIERRCGVVDKKRKPVPPSKRKLTGTKAVLQDLLALAESYELETERVLKFYLTPGQSLTTTRDALSIFFGAKSTKKIHKR